MQLVYKTNIVIDIMFRWSRGTEQVMVLFLLLTVVAVKEDGDVDLLLT